MFFLSHVREREAVQEREREKGVVVCALGPFEDYVSLFDVSGVNFVALLDNRVGSLEF